MQATDISLSYYQLPQEADMVAFGNYLATKVAIPSTLQPQEGHMFATFMILLWILMLMMPLCLLIALLPVGRDCPRCGGETLLLRQKFLRWVNCRIGRRWCTACSWEGMMRYSGAVPPAIIPRNDADWREEGEAWKKGRASNPDSP